MYVNLFSVALFLLLVKNIKKLKQVVIEIEYPGHEILIKEQLINYLELAYQ